MTSISKRMLSDMERALRNPRKKEKTSISLSGEVIDAADVLAGEAGRSAFIERAVRAYLNSLLRRARNRRDLDAINSKANTTNRESDDLLKIQAWAE